MVNNKGCFPFLFLIDMFFCMCPEIKRQMLATTALYPESFKNALSSVHEK